MKKQLLSILGAFATSFALAQSIPNNGFENWTTSTYQDPQYFMTSNGPSNNGGNGTGAIGVVKTNDAYHGNYAVKITTLQVNNDTSQAYIADGNPGGFGGVAYSEKPTSMRLWFKCDVKPGDTALVVLFFKLNGVSISQSIKKIAGTQSTYSLLTIPVNLSQTPDTLLFAVTPSNSLGGNSGFKGIPGSMIQIDSINFTGVNNQPANFNGDFENWQNVTSYALQSWEIEGGHGNNQTVDSYSGNYALELQSSGSNQAGDSTYSSTATTGHSVQYGTAGGYPYTQTTDTLVFYYKYAPADPNDSAVVSLQLKKAGVYSMYQSQKLEAAANYTEVKMPISLMQAPDSVLVFINSSKNWIVPMSYSGSDLIIDDIHFASQSASFSSPNAACVGQSIQLTDISFNSPTTWTWTATGGNISNSNAQNPTVTYTANGTYTINLIAANANGSSTVSNTITINALPVISSQSGNVNVCGDNVNKSFTVTSPGSNSYQWYWIDGPLTPANGTANDGSFGETNYNTNNMTILVTQNYWGPSGTQGVYCVITNSLNCTITTAFDTIFFSPIPAITITPSTTTLCIGSTVTLTAAGASTYSWSNTGEATAAITPSPTITTDYTVTGTDANGCTNTSAQLITVNTCGTDVNQFIGNQISIYPNPNNGSFVIETTSEKTVNIFDINGKLVFSQVISGTTTIDATSLAKGVYNLTLISSEGALNKKLIIVK